MTFSSHLKRSFLLSKYNKFLLPFLYRESEDLENQFVSCKKQHDCYGVS